MLESVFGKLMAKPKGYQAGEVVLIFTENSAKKVRIRWTKYSDKFNNIEHDFAYADIQRFYKSSTPVSRWPKKRFRFLTKNHNQ